jgi:hypothetical protein
MSTNNQNDLAPEETVLPEWTTDDRRDNLNLSLESHPIDWDEAMGIATTLLHEGWASPETECEPAVTGLVEELAGFLCAYGLLPDDMDCEHVRSGKWPVPKRPANEPRGGTSTDDPSASAIAIDHALDVGAHPSDRTGRSTMCACVAPRDLERVK